MTSEYNSNERSVNGVSADSVCILSRQSTMPALGMPTQLQVPTLPAEQEMTYDKSLMKLLQNVQDAAFQLTTPSPVAVAINTTNSASMSVHSIPNKTFLDTHATLVPVPLRLIPMLTSKITDRHLRETYRYYKRFVDKETRAAISEWPEGVLEKQQWRQRMINIGRDIRFLGRKKYQKAVEDTIRAKGLTMNCGQNPTSWSDCLAALFNPDRSLYGRKKRTGLLDPIRSGERG